MTLRVKLLVFENHVMFISWPWLIYYYVHGKDTHVELKNVMCKDAIIVQHLVQFFAWIKGFAHRWRGVHQCI